MQEARLKHRYHSLVEENTLVVAISITCEWLYEKIYKPMWNGVISKRAKVLFLGSCVKASSGEKLEIAELPKIAT